MKRVIVTGGAGFIGSHLVDRLLAENCSIIVLDNFSNGSLKNLEAAQRNSLLKIEEADITDQKAIEPFFRGIDVVYHLAGLADIVPSIERPLEYFRTNVDGTLHVMECARQHRVKRIVYAASSSCYGFPNQTPTLEEAAINPQYPYALTKFLGEQTVLHWGRIYKMNTNSLRLFNVYGPRARTGGTYGAVFKIFLPQKIHGRPFTVVGDGQQTRDFTYVSDVVEAIWRVSESPLRNEIMNVGSGRTVSVNTLVQLLGGGEVVHLPKRPGEPDCTFADISKIKRLLGWRPHVSIEEGVKHLLANIDYWKDAPVWTPEGIQSATREWFQYLCD